MMCAGERAGGRDSCQVCDSFLVSKELGTSYNINIILAKNKYCLLFFDQCKFLLF